MPNKKINGLFLSIENNNVVFFQVFEKFGISFSTVNFFDEKRMIMDLKKYHVIFVDFSFLCAFSVSVLSKIKKRNHSIPVFVVSEEDSSCIAVQCLKLGADDYFIWPLNPKVVLEKLEKKININLNTTEERIDFIPEFIGKSPKMMKLKNQIRRYASSDLPILLIGESGTGKSYLARLIHKYSKNSKNPFNEENMAVVPELLAESVLFGTKKGAYTGAENRMGLVEATKNGTLFLDEISESPLGVQAKLLRVIAEKTYRPLGSTEDKKTDIRLITASNANLKKSIENKTFREDLFYRINPLTIKIPPLRERKDDIPLLIHYFLDKKKKDITFGAIEKLKNHSWKGNVRELMSTLERGICLCSNNTITQEDLIFY